MISKFLASYPIKESWFHVYGSSRDLLLAATLVQFGTKQISTKDLDQHVAKGAECKVAALTLWKSEWNDGSC